MICSKRKSDSETYVVNEEIDREVQARYNKELVDHIVRLNHLGHKNGTPIFPRNGFLLGVIRHRGFLPNETIDPDLACFEEDIPKMLESDWGEYEIDKYYFEDTRTPWDHDFNNLRHPITNRKYKYYMVRFKHISSGWISPEVDCFYKYKPGYYYYPWWSVKGYNSEQNFKTYSTHYTNGGGGAKILLGNEETPLKHLYEKDEYRGKVGFLYKDKYFNSYKTVPFYDKEMYVPIGATDMLKSAYGENVLNVMIDKKGDIIILRNHR